MTTTTIKERYAALSDELKAELLEAFRLAARRRAQQWDAELAMERILGDEISIDMEEWAAGIGSDSDDPGATDHLDEDDLQMALGIAE